MERIDVRLKENSYPIFIGYNVLKRVVPFLKKYDLGNYSSIITTPKIFGLYRPLIHKTFSHLKRDLIIVADGERAKSYSWLLKVLKALIRADGLERKLCLVCLGGGVVGDLGGFAAAIYKRGISYLQIPTTLLGQIDAGIGGKTAIDMAQAKNIVGAFYQPQGVFIDPGFLTTLPLREIKQGICEAIKYGVIRDRDFFYFLKENHEAVRGLDERCMLRLISTCAGIKADIVSKDEKEKKGLRTVLNFGHTLAHALETAFFYKRISHGEAVAIGMRYASYLSWVLGTSTLNAARQITEILRLYSLPLHIKFNPQAVYKSLVYDKKFMGGKTRMVLLKSLGQVKVVEGISPKIIRKTLETFAAGKIDI